MIKKIFLILIAFLFSIRFSYNQNTIKVAPGTGFGYFYPSNINNYLLDMRYDYLIHFMNCFVSIGILKEFKDDVAFKLTGESAVTIDVLGGNIDYSFIRFTVLPSANKYFPVADNSSFYIGAGVPLSYLKFNDWTGLTPGIHGETGFKLDIDDYELELFIAGDFIKTDAVAHDISMNLNYTGIRVGANFIFGFIN